MLPPGLQNRSVHQYGQFHVKVSTANLQITKLDYVELNMLGMRKCEQRMININRQVIFEFAIATNLWFFYAYLNDARLLSIGFKDSNGKKYQSQINLSLIHSKQLLNKSIKNIDFLFQNNSYLLNRKAKGEVFDQRYNRFGFINLELSLKFYEPINRALFTASIIDFQDILVIDQISPISSTVELPDQQYIPLSVEPIKQEQPKQQQKINFFHKVNEEENARQQQNSNRQDQKMMEDDIDRLIAQMQNKPYDSTKYMQTQPPKKQNVNFINTSPHLIHQRSTQKFQRPSSIEKYPPKMAKNISESNTNKSKFAYTVSQPISNYNQIPIQPQVSLKYSRSNSQSIAQKKTGLIKLKVHQFTMSKIQKELNLLLKIYLNQDSDEFYTINGMKQGETISFNTNLKINQKRQINSIKFVLIDAFDMKTIYAQGIFEMTRLFSLNPTKGIFMVNLLSNSIQTNMSRMVRMQEQSLVRVTPNMKNLRIQLQYEQEMQIVQIYLRLTDFSNCKKICYKIPMTKQTIQYKISQISNNNHKHINIFPHNRTNKASDKIIIEAWGENQLIGFNEVSLKPISNTNQLIMNSSIEPILLYDEPTEVKDIKSSKARSSYWLQLYYGTIAQIQNILNQQDQTQKRRQLPNKPIQVENHLGIYIKQTKQRKEVQIQVDQQQITCKGSQKNLLQLQQEQLPDQDQDQLWAQEHKQNEQNQFISKSMEQKYVFDKQKQTLPILKINSTPPSQNVSKSMQFSQTLKQAPLKSLTKQFQQWIKDNLSDLSSQQSLSTLRQQIKSYLLYNFIESSTFTSILQRRGISQLKINNLLNDIIPITNEMINVNIVYDMVLGLILEGEIKQKFIDDYQIGRYCLMTFYNRMADIQQDFLFDQNTQFDQSRKLFQQIGFRITMREFNLIHMFIKRIKQENVKANDKSIKDNLINKFLQQTKQVIVKNIKQKEIISQLYQHQWDQDDDFFISNINQHQHHQQSIAINTPNQHSTTSKHSQNNTQLFYHPINNLNQQKQPQKLPIKFPTPQKDRMPEKTKIENVKQKSKANYKLIIQGFETCIQTTQCLLDLPLRAPKLKITCKTNSKEQQFWISNTKQQSIYQIELLITDSQFLDGSVELTDNFKSIAKCNVSIMSDMRSCYSLKNNETLQFCGILKLLLTSL